MQLQLMLASECKLRAVPRPTGSRDFLRFSTATMTAVDEDDPERRIRNLENELRQARFESSEAANAEARLRNMMANAVRARKK